MPLSESLKPWSNYKTVLPLFLYFGVISASVLLFSILKFFERYKRANSNNSNNNATNNNTSEEVFSKNKKPKLKIETGETSQRTFYTKWIKPMMLQRIKFYKVREYFPLKTEKRWGLFERRQEQPQQPKKTGKFFENVQKISNQSNVTSPGNVVSHSSKVDFNHSKSNSQEDDDDVFSYGVKSRSQVSSMNEEGSLTRVVITQIERHRQQQNLEIEDYKRRLNEQSSNSNCHNQNKSILKIIDSDGKDTKALDNFKSSSYSNNQIDRRLNVPLNHFEEENDSEPIYDVPPSKSLINLSSMSSLVNPMLPKQQRVHNSEVTYYHTSSPNLLAVVGRQEKSRTNNGEEEEESIYDTPRYAV